MSTLRKSALTVVFWRAVRLAAPIALISCGPPNLTVLSTAPNACAPLQRATCTPGKVQVQTDLPPGTELTRPECDAVCLSVNCAGEEKRCTVESQPLTGARVVLCQPTSSEGCAVPGRPPDRLLTQLPAPQSTHEVFAQMATYEAASVASFEELATFLDAANAPAGLVMRARAAARDEKRHARIAAELAGLSEVPMARVAPRRAPLTLAKLAEENFCDGCINEGASAVTTATQAQNAADPEVRQLLSQVATDEFGHAELSWELHAWLVPQLSADERVAVHAAGMRKARAMLEHTEPRLDATILEETGLPSGQTLRAQTQLLFDELWAPALEALAA